jgi:hypothetical protein
MKAYEKALKNLVDFEEGYKDIINSYYPQQTNERLDLVELLTGYIKKLNST